MSGDAPWKWRRPERTTSSPVPSSSSSRAPLSSHDAAPPPHFPAFLPYKSPPSHPQRRGRDPNTENAAPRTASSAGPVPRDADRALILRDIVDGAFAHACSLTPHRTPARSTSELAYFAPATVSSRTAERELVAVAAAADRAAARIAEEDPIARERALALRQSQLARLRADARDVEASREVADADARVVADADARVVADADARRAETAAETVASGYAVAASVADAEARRRYRASRDAFALESRAFRGDPYDATLGPGFGPAARARDRRRVAEEVDAAYRRCAACDRGEPHPLRSCDFALGLALGAADRPLRPAEERLGVVDGGATVIEAMRRGGNAALFDAATWRASASVATRAGADPTALESAPESAPGAESGGARRLARALAEARTSPLVDAALADADAAAADQITSLTLRSRRLTTFPRLPRHARRLRSIILTRNDIAEVPDDVAASAPALSTLDLSRNALRGTLGVSVAAFTRLTALRLDDNPALVALPACLGRLAALRELRVARCGLASLPVELSSCVETRVLDVTGNRLRALPAGLFSPSSRLRELWARDNALASLPPTLADAARLRRLDVGGNRLETFPNVSRLARLETLSCARNRLVVAPPGLGPGCASLEVLDLDFNRLTTLGASDDGVASLPKLRTVTARGNRVATVGRALGRSKSLANTLVHVDLRNNRLRGVPASVGRLRALQRLLLFDDEETWTSPRSASSSFRAEPGPELGSSARRVLAPRSRSNAARALAESLDFLESVDVELSECDDWSPGARDACGVDGNANGRGEGIARRRSVSVFWPGAASRGGVAAPLDGGPGLGGVGVENSRDFDASKSKREVGDAVFSAFEVKDERRATMKASEWKPREANEGDVASRRLARGSELDRVQASTLARAPVFEAMSPRDTRVLADSGGYVVRSYASGAPVMTKGDEREESLAMFVIIRGAAEILKTDVTDTLNETDTLDETDKTDKTDKTDETRGQSNDAKPTKPTNADPSNPSDVASAFAALRRALATRVARAGRPVTFGSSGDCSDRRRAVVSGVLLPGDAFGESCLLAGAPQPDDVRAGPEGVETLALTRDAAELAFVNAPGLAAAVARRAACRHVLAAAAYDFVSSVAFDPTKDIDSRRRVSDVSASDVERAAIDAVGEEGVAAVARRLLAAMDARFGKRAEGKDAFESSRGSSSKTSISTSKTSTSTSTRTASALWARARRTFFVERWRRRARGFDILRCFTAEETRDALRRGASEVRLETGRVVVREGDDAGVPSLVVVTRGSLLVFARSRVETRRPDGVVIRERRESPILNAARLSYSSGRNLPVGSRGGGALSPAFAPAEAEHVPCGRVLEGGTFGEYAALAGGAGTMTAACAERDTEVLLVPGPAFAEVVRRRPSLCDDLARALAWREATANAAAEAVAKGTRAAPEPPSAREMVELAGKMETLFTSTA